MKVMAYIRKREVHIVQRKSAAGAVGRGVGGSAGDGIVVASHTLSMAIERTYQQQQRVP